MWENAHLDKFIELYVDNFSLFISAAFVNMVYTIIGKWQVAGVKGFCCFLAVFAGVSESHILGVKRCVSKYLSWLMIIASLKFAYVYYFLLF